MADTPGEIGSAKYRSRDGVVHAVMWSPSRPPHTLCNAWAYKDPPRNRHYEDMVVDCLLCLGELK